ncbi:MAG: hypothetical protein ACI4V1_09160 [Eubacteriales bacterium]
MKKFRPAAFAAALLLAAGMAGTAPSNASDVPSLFHNDEAWYKDGAAPLVLRDGVYYVPAELFGMFESISVTTPNENNLLIQNTEDGRYVSILFQECRAAVNGTILENVRLFRDSGVYYVEAEPTAATVGISVETITHEDGSVSMRLYDDTCLLTTEELLNSYFPAEPEEDEFAGLDEEEERDLKRIFVLCREPSADTEPSFCALSLLREYGMDYTLFLTEDTAPETLLTALSVGEYGILTSETGEEALEALNETNETFRKITRVRTHFTLTTGSYASDDLLRGAGYCPVTPDFIVTAYVDADVVFADMMQYLGAHDYCVLLLEDCWQTGRMVELMNQIDRETFMTSNLGNG